MKNKTIESLALMDVFGRVARPFMQLAKPSNGKQIIEDKLPHQDIASMVAHPGRWRAGFIRIQAKVIMLIINNKTI